jgi:hypothetical protein
MGATAKMVLMERTAHRVNGLSGRAVRRASPVNQSKARRDHAVRLVRQARTELANRDRKAWSGLRGLKGSRVIAAIRALVNRVHKGCAAFRV